MTRLNDKKIEAIYKVLVNCDTNTESISAEEALMIIHEIAICETVSDIALIKEPEVIEAEFTEINSGYEIDVV